MAQVPTLDQPQVSQQVGPVGPQQVNSQAANPLLAGAQATSDLAQHAMAIQGTMNQLAANDSSNAVLPQLDKIVSDYATNSKGVFAAANAPDALKALETTFAQGKQGLSLDAQISYDQTAHRAYGYAVSAVQRHVTTQTNEAIVSSSKASIENNAGLGTMALLAGDEEGLHAAIGEIAKKTAFMQTGAGLGTGADTDAGHLMLAQNTGVIYVNAVKQLLAQNDYPRARAVLDDNYNHDVQNMTPTQYTQLDSMLKEKGQASMIHTIMATYLKGGGAPTTANLSDAIAGAEHGTNPVTGDGLTSPAGAQGKFQIMPGTAAQYGAPINGQPFDPNNPDHVDTLKNDEAYNTQTHQAILAHLSQKYGGNPLLIAGAYNAGEGWMDRQLANPKIGSPQVGQEQAWIASLPDKGVAHYVADVASRLQPQGPPTTFSTNTDPDAVEAAALKRGMAFIDTQPIGMQDQLRTELVSQLNIQKHITTLGINSAIRTLDAGIMGVNGQSASTDLNDLLSRPGMNEAYNSLPDGYKALVPKMLGQAASVPPSARQQWNAEQIMGAMNLHPTQAADLNFAQYDLSPRDRVKIMLEATKIQAQETKVEDNTRSMLSSPSAQAYVKLNFPKPADRVNNPEYNQFVGALLGKTRAFMQDPANKGQFPQSGDIDNMVRDLTQERTVGNFNVGGVDLGFGGHTVDNGYVVPAPAAAYIKADLLARKQNATDTEIARHYFINPAYFDQASAPKGKK